MNTAKYIDTLLRKYQKAPGFPFYEWTRDPVQFYALINIWDEIFRVAAGSEAARYEAGNDVKMDLDSLIYDVRRADKTRRIAVYPEKEGGVFAILTSRGDDEYDQYGEGSGYWPDRTELSLAIDLDRNRLCAAFDMIQRYVREDLPDFSAAESLHADLITKYRHMFGFSDYNPFENYDVNGHYIEPPDDDE